MLSTKEAGVIDRHFAAKGARARVAQWDGAFSVYDGASGRLWVHNDTPRKQALQELYFYSRDSQVGTLTCSHPVKLWDLRRRLTPRELANLMGFPAPMKLPRTRVTRLFGNAVCVPCARHALRSVVPGAGMRHLDVCAGIGGFAFAARSLGCALVGYSEIDAAACACFEENFPRAKALGDAARVGAWPRCDVLTAGFPCQPFSNCNSRARRTDHAARDFFKIILRAVDRSQARAVVFENVVHFRTVGRAQYERLVDGLAARGFTLAEAVLDARAFGLPQARKRLFIVGRRGGAPPSLAAAAPSEDVRIRDILEKKT